MHKSLIISNLEYYKNPKTMQLNLFALEMPKKEVTIENLPYQYAFDAVRNF